METFEGRVAVVTGAASGIGRGMAERFAAEGMRVVLADVEAPALDNAERVMSDKGADVLAVRADVSRREDVEALAEQAYARYGAVHIVCNNAGVGAGGLTWETTAEDWQWVLGVNLWGVIHGISAFVPRMIAGNEDGHIVNTASMAGLLAGPFMASYNVSKFGVVALSETLHHELTMFRSKIGVSVLCPGFVNTNIDNSGRNRPGGAHPEPEAGTPEAQLRANMRQMLESGMSPENVAGQVFDAIRAQRFYILTHPEFVPAVSHRAEAIVDGTAPPSPGFL